MEVQRTKRPQMYQHSFIKEGEPTQILTLTVKEYKRVHGIIDSFYYLCRETKEEIEFTKEDLFYITFSEFYQSERLERFIEYQSMTMLEVVQIVSNDLYIDESYMVFESMELIDPYDTKYQIVCRSTMLSELQFCIDYDKETREFHNYFIYTGRYLFHLYRMFEHDVYSERVKNEFITVVKKQKQIRLNFLF
ncbi:hypothetical protein LT338_27500 [Bacillus sp. UTDS19-33BHI26]|uniref:hypothetical protein n=1 Tax=Bacillus sp. UTDS19-33BHI26 TaxID=2901441 RepID=UPI001ED9EFA6|nr:hypothetical protein [Bacillus sp. UTDS19-33BHI26]MCG3791520.1 hypothetical protein [Bacillus sp. UTDS19-33BHI26]